MSRLFVPLRILTVSSATSALGLHLCKAQVHSPTCLHSPHISTTRFKTCNGLHDGQHILPGPIVGVGNPFLEHTVAVTLAQQESIFSHYRLLANQQTLLDEADNGLFRDLASGRLLTHSCPFTPSGADEHLAPVCTSVPGGSTLNAIRVAQWLLNTPGSCAFVGSVGDDEAQRVISEVEQLGIQLLLQRHSGMRSGQSVSFINSVGSRSVAVSLGATIHLTANFFHEKSVKELIEKSSMVYVSGYLWRTSPEIIQALSHHCVSNHRRFLMNLNSALLCCHFADQGHHVLAPVDYLFGNETEALAFAKGMVQHAKERLVRERFSEFLNLPVAGTDQLERIALYTSQLVKASPGPPRTVIITQGRVGPVVICRGEETLRVDVTPEPQETTVDTHGCGDAFIGGVLAQLSLGANVADAVHFAMMVARLVARQRGCTLPAKLPDDLKTLLNRQAETLASNPVSASTSEFRKETVVNSLKLEGL